ncbi:PREDICTED: prestin-like [Wasmannia auropunctata]|uniref:prestin-like n=1 Tax=Wasmannia auropunctata TaxID=64793 RepID=UPI0005EFB7A9|nr:PREDICTED: prestin-like [Wasmannia auropunctata]
MHLANGPCQIISHVVTCCVNLIVSPLRITRKRYALICEFMDKSSMLQIRMERPLYEHETLNENFNYKKPKSSLLRNAINNVKSKNWQSFVLSTIPVVQWLREYNWREDILPDIISGLTVAIMHIPQGMAYALLGNLPPVVGIYMAFFPVFIYFFFGTSRHVSIGTFAVVCLMTGKVVTVYSSPHEQYTFANVTETVSQNLEDVAYVYTPMQVATAVTLMVGIFQIIMYTFRLGIVTTLLSETLVNSFTTAAAVYVLISQIKDLLGLKLPKQKGYFKLIFVSEQIIFFRMQYRELLFVQVALKGMFQQADQLVKFWKLSKADATIWIVTFLVVTLINIDIGLLAGLLVSLVIILLQVIRPYTCLLGHIPHTDLYLDIDRYKAAVEIRGIKIFHYCGTLNFANNSYFKSIVYRLVGVCPQKIIKYRKKLTEEGRFLDEKGSKETCELQCIIMDMSALSYIDPSSVQVLHVIVEEFTQVDIEFYFVNCPSPIYETIKKCDLYVYGIMSLKIFATIQDAIIYFQNEIASR